MDDQERGRLESWLNEKWNHGPCPVCQSNSWATAARLGEISNLDTEDGRMPVLLIGCQTCGYQVVVNALVAGIREAKYISPTGEPSFVSQPDPGSPADGSGKA